MEPNQRDLIIIATSPESPSTIAVGITRSISSLHITDENSPRSGGEQTRPTVGILDLPDEILHLIFDEFLVERGLYEEEGSREACWASWLTCRRLCAAATTMLFDTLTTDLDAESARRTEVMLSQNPLIAASVRTLVVSLGCRDPAQARDLGRGTTTSARC
ncbi:hypothetical protein PG996_006304 [Apiospora saccharicola]|uniref:F-box domain-containing protein n=1 Tax=Apiospora saccharicola TaxID=335842 RepID=A0ABR1VNX5_9PEZI